MANCPKCGTPVNTGVLFCSEKCKKSKRGSALPLAYRVTLGSNEPVKLLNAVLVNMRHSPPSSYRMRQGNRCDPTGIICELSQLGEWVNLDGGLWAYKTPAGMDYLGMPADVVEWSGLSLADAEKIQHGYDRKARHVSKRQRLDFAVAIISDIIRHYEKTSTNQSGRASA